MNRRRRYPPSNYHQGTGDYRNISVPKVVHRQLAHIALDHDISVSEIMTTLAELFILANAGSAPDSPLNFHDLRIKTEASK